ncbi:hypothetical protein RhiirA1_461327 [Rhizophagus irregularis]|uniref:Uncharacterized protein n=1 Tax=Rhizophagus irregularis TaxID=588596 RepID=A0A2I1EIV2_9GLOM|nr:hypothetical protein RhiirA1_461327 [Rhizophagus irregularis]PKY22063.1 hypothetical protein RhiirB3_435863 [Rhizophagus irregularis]
MLTLLTVTVTSDPPVSYNPASFTVSGKLSKGDITVGQTFLRIEYDEADSISPKTPLGNIHYQALGQSLKAGEQLNLLLLQIAVVDQPSDPKDPYEVHACAIDTVLP